MILVIGNHAQVPGLAGGYIGVDVFLVISGYVITQLLLRETDRGMGRGLIDFYSRRVRRIVPAATAVLIATVAVAGVALGPRVDPNLAGDVRWAASFSANFRFITTGTNYFVPGLAPSLTNHFWSLAVEEQFYLVLPLLVFSVARFVAPARRTRVLSTVLAGGTVASAGWSIATSAREPIVAYYSPFTRFWELGLGCLLASRAGGRLVRTARGERLAALLAVLLLAAALLDINARTVYPGWRAWLPCGAAALLVWAGAGGGRNPVTRLLSNRLLVHLGDLSYSLYLTHYAWLKLPGLVDPTASGWAWTLLELGGTWITAECSHHLLENPIRRSPRLAGDPVATALMLAVCVAASWTSAAHL